MRITYTGVVWWDLIRAVVVITSFYHYGWIVGSLMIMTSIELIK